MQADAARSPRDASWIEHLERAHERSHAVARRLEEEPTPAGDLAPPLRSIERAVAAIYDALDGRDDRPSSISRAHGRLWDAAIRAAQAGVPDAVDALRDACADLIEAERLAPSGPLPDDAPPALATLAPSRSSPRDTPPSSALSLSASIDALPLHTIPRRSLQPSFRAPPPPPAEPPPLPEHAPPPTTFAELAAAAKRLQKLAEERRAALTSGLTRPDVPSLRSRVPLPDRPPEGFATAPVPPMSEDDFARKWGRECFEEIGMLGVHRAPLPDEDWRSCRALEDRLLASLDAFAALGAPAIAHVETLALDAPTPDPLRIFAAALIAGCTRGRDALGMAERVLHRYGAGDPIVAQAFSAAMQIAPHPLLPRVLRRLAGLPSQPDRPSLGALGPPPAGDAARLLATQLLARRGLLSPFDLPLLATHQDPHLRAIVLETMGAARHPDLDRAAQEALQETGALALTALDALLVSASPRAAQAARQVASRAHGPSAALLRLAIAASDADAAWLLDRARESPSPEALEALGWTGALAAVPWLLDQLSSSDQNTQSSAASALTRLLGATLVQKVEIDPESLDSLDVHDPDPAPPRPRLSLADLIDDARDRVPLGSTETREVPSTDPEAWRACFADQRPRLDPTKRWRRGQPHCASVTLYELDKLPLPAEERRLLHIELCHRTARYLRFSPADLVVTQEKTLRGWSDIVRSARETPGAW